MIYSVFNHHFHLFLNHTNYIFPLDMEPWGDKLTPVELLSLLWDLPVSVASAVFSFHDIFLLDQESAMFAPFSTAHGCSSPPSRYCSSQHTRKMSFVAVPGCCSYTFSFHMYEPFGLSINMQGPSLPSPTSLESSLLHIVNTKKQEIRS